MNLPEFNANVDLNTVEVQNPGIQHYQINVPDLNLNDFSANFNSDKVYWPIFEAHFEPEIDGIKKVLIK